MCGRQILGSPRRRLPAVQSPQRRRGDLQAVREEPGAGTAVPVGEAGSEVTDDGLDSLTVLPSTVVQLGARRVRAAGSLPDLIRTCLRVDPLGSQRRVGQGAARGLPVVVLTANSSTRAGVLAPVRGGRRCMPNSRSGCLSVSLVGTLVLQSLPWRGTGRHRGGSSARPRRGRWGARPSRCRLMCEQPWAEQVTGTSRRSSPRRANWADDRG